MDSDMEVVLKSLNLGEGVITAFNENGVGCREAVHLTDSEFLLLGVSKIGDRARIRMQCRDILSGEASTLPAVKRLRDMMTKHHRGHAVGETSRIAGKDTLRVYVGWKHRDRLSTKAAKQVLLSQGGGTHHLDIARTATLKELLNKIKDTFFPDGENKSRQLLLKELQCKLTKFNGNEIGECLPSGKAFTLERFFSETSRPVRLYLETSFINEDLVESDSHDSGEDVLPDMSDVLHCEKTPASNQGPSTNQTDTPSTSFSVIQPDTPTVTFPQHARSSTSPPPGQAACSHLMYQNYVNILEDSSEEDDEDMALAIAASLTENRPTRPVGYGEEDYPRTCMDVVRNLANMVSYDDDPVTVVVHRKRVLSSTLRTVASEEFNFWKPINVVFSGEDAVDEGGPRREFLKLLMRDLLTSSGIFKTRNGKATFSYDLKLLNQNTYKLAGQLVLWSLSHGGPGLQALCPSVYSCMAGVGNVDLSDIDSIPDLTAQMNMEKLKSSSNDEEFRQAVTDQLDWLLEQGVCNAHKVSFADKDQLLKDLLTHQLYHRVQSCIIQFKEGLGPLAHEVESCPRQLQHLFVRDDAALTLQTFKGLYQIEYSPIGSNNRAKEEDTVFCWEVFLQDCTRKKSELTLANLLEFWTGAERPPPAGFGDTLHVSFYSTEGGCRRLPSSSTCGLVLNLPRGIEDPDELESMLLYAVQETQGFGRI